MDEQAETVGDDVFLTGSRVQGGAPSTGQGCLIAAGLAIAAGIGLLLLIFPLAYGVDLMTGEDERGVARGLILTVVSAALAIWGAGWVFRWNTRRMRRAEVEARLPGFTGRTIPAGQLLNGPAAAGKLEGKYLMAVGRDHFLLMRHFHNTEHLDAFRALIIGQFINAYRPNGLARAMDFAIPYRNVKTVTVEALTPEELRKGAFGRAVVHGLASWALDAAFGTRSTQDIKAAFLRIEMVDGQSLVFSVPSRVTPGLVSALAASTDNVSRTAGHEISLGEATWDGIETLLDSGGIIDAPSDGWDDFLAALNPQGKRARAFAALAALRIQQEIDRALGRSEPARPRPSGAGATRRGGARAAGFDAGLKPGLWGLGLIVWASLFIALSDTLRQGGNGDLEPGLIVLFTGVAMVVGVNLWAQRSGWLMAGIKSGLSLGLAGLLAYAIGVDALLTRGPLAPASQSLASGTASLFGREHRPGAAEQPPVQVPPSAEAEAKADAETLAAARAAAEQIRQQELARTRADRLAAAERIVRTVYDDELSLFGSRTERSAWLTPGLSRRIDQLNAAADGEGGAGAVIGFDPLVDGQDVDLGGFDYASRETDYGVEVRARFTNFGEPVDLAFEMIETEAGWRVRDIRSRAPEGRTRWSVTGLLDAGEREARSLQ